MCKAKIWKKRKLENCTRQSHNNDFCGFHKEYNIDWLDSEKFTICKRCNKGFEKNTNKRCDNCNEKCKKEKREDCQFIKKNGDQCTNQRRKKSKYCGTHIPYVEKGVTSENRCMDCGNPKEPENKNNVCNQCKDKRNGNAKKKRQKLKEIHLNTPIKPIVENEWEVSPFYIGGFFDGDGSICIDKKFTLQISFSQCPSEILFNLQGIFGGCIYVRDMSDNPNQRDQHNLRICGRECEKILAYLDIGSIMKWDQIQVAKRFIKMNNLQNLIEEKTKLRDEMKILNQSYKKTHNKRYDCVNWEYIAGIFDAEGCIHLKKKKKKNGDFRFCFGYIKITQTNDYHLLDAIRNFVGHGKSHSKEYWKTERIDFAKYDLKKIVPLLVVKQKQAKWCLDFFETEDEIQKEDLYKKIKEDIHKLIEYN